MWDVNRRLPRGIAHTGVLKCRFKAAVERIHCESISRHISIGLDVCLFGLISHGFGSAFLWYRLGKLQFFKIYSGLQMEVSKTFLVFFHFKLLQLNILSKYVSVSLFDIVYTCTVLRKRSTKLL